MRRSEQRLSTDSESTKFRHYRCPVAHVQIGAAAESGVWCDSAAFPCTTVIAGRQGGNRTISKLADRLQRFARERADEEARRIPWQRLQDARTQYIDWQEFYLWVRSILEVEGRIPNWLVETLNTHCPGFFENENRLLHQVAAKRPLALLLEDWIDEYIFGFAKQEGWFNAITYYAVRDPRYQRAEVCWSECARQWKGAVPIRYPSFCEWQAIAAQSDETAHLTARERKARASDRLVHPDRLVEAVTRYVDYEALAYWARPALESRTEYPAEVVCQLDRRCPGFLTTPQTEWGKASDGSARDWEHLMLWIGDRFFQAAKAEGWFDAILVHVRSHPRAIRTMEYADHCEELRGAELPIPYPPFVRWRRDADSYIDQT
ncbi:MAG TPA: hypothetical protein VMT53_00500 [Terriglobales bacterium]|nr:hypothetical protein [Terriglobales bacterium]